jgi:hypothetical protein
MSMSFASFASVGFTCARTPGAANAMLAAVKTMIAVLLSLIEFFLN